MRAFKLHGKGTYHHGSIRVIGTLSEPDTETFWIFHENVRYGKILCLRGDVFKNMYICSGTSSRAREMPCIGVYESVKRLRVVPFCCASSPRGEESIVAYRELITGRDYALPLDRFGKIFKLDFLYDSGSGLPLEAVCN